MIQNIQKKYNDENSRNKGQIKQRRGNYQQKKIKNIWQNERHKFQNSKDQYTRRVNEETRVKAFHCAVLEDWEQRGNPSLPERRKHIKTKFYIKDQEFQWLQIQQMLETRIRASNVFLVLFLFLKLYIPSQAINQCQAKI